MKIFDFKNIFTFIKANYKKYLGYVLALILIIILFARGCDKDRNVVTTSIDCNLLELKVDSLTQALTIQKQLVDKNPTGVVIKEPVDNDLIDKKVLIKTQERKAYYKNLYATMVDKYNQAIEDLDNVEAQEPIFVTVPIEPLPIVETIKTDSSANHNLTVTTESQGPLESIAIDLDVTPVIIEKPGQVITKTETKLVKRKQFIGIGGGVLRYEGSWNPISQIQYNRGIFAVQAGMIHDSKTFKPKGVNDLFVNGSVVIKFK